MISEAAFKKLIHRKPLWLKPDEVVQLSTEQLKNVYRIIDVEKKIEGNRKARIANDKAEARVLEAETVAHIIAQQLGSTAAKLEQNFRVLPDKVHGLKTIEETRRECDKAHDQLLESFRDQWEAVRRYTIRE